MKSTAGLFIRISSEESYAKEVENIRFSCIAGCKKAGYCVAQYPELFRGGMIFHGRVQGVGFRYTAKYLARSMNLTGWVKNEYDGTVVMEVQGRETLIFELMKGLNRNQFIQIDWIDTEEMEPELESSFEVKY